MNAIEEIQQAISNENIVNAMRTAARDILPVVAKRIFEDGKDSNGNKIGEYSTRPITVEPEDTPIKSAAGYYPGGYRQFKQTVRNTTVVNYNLFGNLQTDYTTSKEVVSGLNMRFELKDVGNIEKKDYLEKRFKKDVFTLSESEEKTVRDTFRDEIFLRT